MRLQRTQRGFAGEGLEQGWRGVWLPIVVGAAWMGVAWTLAGFQRSVGLPGWSAVALLVAGAGGAPVLAMGLIAALTRVRVEIDTATGTGSWSRRWAFAQFGERERTAFALDRVARVRIKKEASGSGAGRGPASDETWRVRLELERPARRIEIGLYTDKGEAEALRDELKEAIASADARPSRDGPGEPLVSRALTPAQRAALERALEPGERVVWTDRARVRLHAERAGAWPTTLFGFVWLGLVVGAGAGPVYAGLLGFGAPGWLAACGAGLLAAVLGWPGLVFATSSLWAPWLAWRTGYALSDRRVLALEGRLLGAPRVVARSAGQMSRARVEERADGSGHVLWGEDEGLLGLDTPREVEALIRRTLKEND